MVITILIWSYIFFLSFSLAGGLFSVLLGKNKHSDITEVNFFLFVLSGLILISFFISVFSLFFKTGLLTNLLFGALSLVSWLFLKPLKHVCFTKMFPGIKLPALIFLLGVIFSSILLMSIREAGNPDTALYHAQTIHWIETYPAVPGLGNYYSNLAYNSSWHVLSALFSFSFLGGQSFHVLGGFLFLFSVLYLFDKGLRSRYEGRMFSSWARLLLIPLLYWVFLTEVSSLGTDYPAAVFCLIVFSEWLDLFENKTKTPFGKIFVSNLFTFSAVTIKLSVLPVMLFFIWQVFYFLRNKEYFRLFVQLALGIVILSPWLARSLIQSGYLLYPFPGLDIFDFDWKIPVEIVREEKQIILAWARIPGEDLSSVLSLPFSVWTLVWFKNSSLNQRFLLIFLGIYPFLLVVLRILLPGKMQTFFKLIRQYKPLYFSIYAGLIFWFLSAPSIRFGYGFILFGLVLAVVPLLLWVFEGFYSLQGYLFGLFIIMLCLFLSLTLVNAFEQKVIKEAWFIPLDYKSMPTSVCEFENFNTLCGDYSGICWYEPFPCAPAGDLSVAKRGETFREGFRHLGK